MCADIMLQMGFSQEEIQDSLVSQRYNDVMATYLLLDYRNSEVCCFSHLHDFSLHTVIDLSVLMLYVKPTKKRIYVQEKCKASHLLCIQDHQNLQVAVISEFCCMCLFSKHSSVITAPCIKAQLLVLFTHNKVWICSWDTHMKSYCFSSSAGWRLHQAPARKWCKHHKRPLPATQGTMITYCYAS